MEFNKIAEWTVPIPKYPHVNTHNDDAILLTLIEDKPEDRFNEYSPMYIDPAEAMIYIKVPVKPDFVEEFKNVDALTHHIVHESLHWVLQNINEPEACYKLDNIDYYQKWGMWE